MGEQYIPRTAEIIYNPGAGKAVDKTGVATTVADRLRRHGWEVTVRRTTHAGHATAFAASASERRIGVLFPLGGDGTINEIVDGLKGNTVVGVLGGGTVNVWANEAEIPSNPLRAVDALLRGEVHVMDVGELVFQGDQLGEVSRSFFLMAGIGYDGQVFNQELRSLTIRQ
jgi:diacylglycerol kinase (ATP)